MRYGKTFGRSGAFQAMRPVPGVSRASTARWEGPAGASDGPTAFGGRLANFSELPCSILASKKRVLLSPSSSPTGALGRARGPCYTGQHNKPAQDGNERRRRAPHTRAIFSKIKGGASRKRRKSHPVRWRAWRRKSP